MFGVVNRRFGMVFGRFGLFWGVSTDPIFTIFLTRLDARVSCRHTFSPVICFRQLLFCREDFPLNDVTVYLDLSFDRAIDFPIYLMKFVDQNAQIEGKLLVTIKHKAIYMFSAISNFLMH